MKKGLIVVAVVMVVIIIFGLRIVLKSRKVKIPIGFRIQVPENAFGPKVTRGVCVLWTGGFAGDPGSGFVIWEKEGQVLIDKRAGKYVSYPDRVLSLNLTEGESFEAASLTKLIDRSRELKGLMNTLVVHQGADITYYYIVIKDGGSELVYEIDPLNLDRSSTRRLYYFLELVDK